MLLGASHALEVDHLVAVTGFVAQRPSLKSAAGFGLRWGIGHSVTVVLLGAILLVLGAQFPARLEQGAELLVGLLLIVVGAVAFTSSRKLSRSEVRDQPRTAQRGVTAVGLVHGIAGTGGVMALVPIAMSNRPVVVVSYLLVFSLGVVVAMTCVATVTAGAMRRSIDNSVELGRAVVRVVGSAGIAVGVWWIIRAAG